MGSSTHTRQEVRAEVRELFGPRAGLEVLLGSIQEAWHTRDLLIKQFGSEYAQHIQDASTLLCPARMAPLGATIEQKIGQTDEQPSE